MGDSRRRGYSAGDSSTSSSAEKGKLENKKAKDSGALYYIQTAVADHIFPRISVATSAKEAWSILQKEYQGSAKNDLGILHARKSEVFKVFKKFKNLVEKQSGRSIKVLKSDRGKEYNNSEFESSVKKRVSNIKLLSVIILNKMECQKKKNRVMEMARSMLQEKHLPKAFWAEAVYTAVYLLNRCPTKAVQNMTPIEAWSGKKPLAKHLRVFGSICYVHIPTEKRHKLEEKTEKGIFRLQHSQKATNLHLKKTKKLIISRDVEFDENAMWNWDEEKV
ncbi:Retrovirus-related Pol polyprotein from transposon TNT 1-94 [Sesamum angolense]|uniref:Retrovirus-related Pol polyprotein from transposon TNT 1-94 n=1 Tax=Sesamum angolense TaxID=2727404 RepID=A0AAE1X6D4_9LAMI|nr:Retrovirus-related Pol polyprotein from transposon TNT 1-94 [Sesamum angolense]